MVNREGVNYYVLNRVRHACASAFMCINIYFFSQGLVIINISLMVCYYYYVQSERAPVLLLRS